MNHFTVKQLKEHLNNGSEQTLLLDVREHWEFQKCSIKGSKLIPMNDIPNSLNKLNPKQKTVVICHHGVRSFNVAQYLERNGFKDVINLTGGVDAWAREIDPKMAKY